MKLIRLKNTIIGRFNIFEPYHELTHFISTRQGGVSLSPYHSLNLGFGTDDLIDNVKQNRYLLADELGIPLDWFVFPRQTHSCNVHLVGIQDRGAGSLSRDDAIPNTDALITNQSHTCIAVQVADCVPVLIFDTVEKIIAVVHTGWRGTAQNILSETFLKMKNHFNSNPSNIIAAIGPSIQECCYEVKDDVYQAFNSWNHHKNEIFKYHNKKLYLNLQQANRIILINEGVLPQNIEISPFCTFCNPNLFFSSRYNLGNTGRFVAAMMLW